MDTVSGKSTEELREELAAEEAKRPKPIKPDVINFLQDLTSRVNNLESETEANAQAVIGLGKLESKHDTSNTFLFALVGVSFCLCAYICNKNTADIILMRKRILEQGNLLNDLAELAGKVGE